MSLIVCISPAPWQSTPTRTQQLMSRLKGTEVLFFEPASPGSKDYKRPGRKVRPGVTAYTLPKPWTTGPERGFSARRGWRKNAEYIQGIVSRRGGGEPLLWCVTPQGVHLLDYLAYTGLVYDCDRYWTGLPLEWESDLALAADVVFAASAGLADRLGPCSDNIALLPNGCNFPMFSREDIEVPDELADLIGPILGYAGTLWADLDYSPVLTCIAAHPDWNFLFIGRQEDSPGLRKLKEMDQVILADRCPLIQVPDYIRQCDVCMDLRREGVANDVMPGRVFEYLSAGKPVVRHSFPGQMEDFPQGIGYQSDDPHGFTAACEQAIREESGALRRRRRETGQAAAWDNRAAEIQRILESNALL